MSHIKVANKKCDGNLAERIIEGVEILVQIGMHIRAEKIDPTKRVTFALHA